MLYVLQNLARIYVENERHGCAKEYIAMAKDLAEQCNHRRCRYQLNLIEGKDAVATGDLVTAEACFIAARRGLCEMKELDDAAYVSLELAILYAKQDRHAEVFSIVAEVLQLLDSLRSHEEISIALELLHDSIRNKVVSLATLEESRDLVEKYLKSIRLI